MASSRDYRKPRNSEIRDLLVHLPQPVKVVDGAGHLLWQNQAAENLIGEAEWTESQTSWQGKKATLCLLASSEPQPDPLIAELQAENERLRKHQRSTARKKKKAEDSAKYTEKSADAFEKRERKFLQQLQAAERKLEESAALLQAAEQRERELILSRDALESELAHQAEKLRAESVGDEARTAELMSQLNAAEARYAELGQELEAFRLQTDVEASQRQLEEQLAEKVRELEELEQAFAKEQEAFILEKREWETRLGEQEAEFLELRERLNKSLAQNPDPGALGELKESLEEAKASLAESLRREQRLSEKLESAAELKEEQSKLLGLLREELQQSRETIKLYEGFRDQSRDEAKKYKTEAEQAREASEKLEVKLLESRRELSLARSGSLPKGIPLGDQAADASPTVRSQLEFAQSRLRETEKQLDEARAALKKAQSDAISAKDTEKLAFQDSLTGLPNRHIVDRYLEISHKQAKTSRRAYSLFLIDIDGFRVFNDTFGREWGDALLKAVGERLAGMRGGNHIFARHSEDRFLLLAADLAENAVQKYVDEACRSLLGALSHPFEVKGEQVSLTGSIGISLGPTATDDPRELFGQAELALESAKARGINTYFVHNESLRQQSQQEATYQRQMSQALERDEIFAVYQPIFHLHKGLVMGVELLLRWKHRDLRILHPEEFLGAAVRSGLIFPLVDKVWPKAFQALARWRRLRPGLTLSINLSDRELLSPRLVERASRMAKEAGVEPSAILFEVRDASRLRTTNSWWRVLGALRSAGFGLVLDDFGSDASLFGTLAYAGFSQAKVTIDEKHPVCPPAPNARKGMLYCAKRIQTRFDPKALKKAGFDLAQGYAVASPIDETDVDGVLGR